MSLRAVRLVKAKHARHAFDGEGARLHGGRWTSVGRPAAYAADSGALAMLEVLVHVGVAGLLNTYVRFELTFDPELVTALERRRLPRGWRTAPPPAALQRLGDQWLDDAPTPLLRVPSAVVPEEFNYVLNPAHPRMDAVRIGPPEPVVIDPRLLKAAR